MKRTRFISERLILEAEDFEQETDDSLDRQVDRYFGQYETEAKSTMSETRTLRDTFRRFLNEVEEEGDGEEGDDEGAVGGDEEPLGPPAKLTGEDIDVEAFVNSVVRLTDNYDTLLEIRDTVVRRAKNFLSKTYDPDVVEMFETVLREDHGVVVGKSEEDVADDEFVAPTGERGGLDPNAGGGAV